MPRALTIVRTKVSEYERATYLDGVRRRRAHYRAAKCSLWVFEDPTDPGLFVEFAEAGDADTLASARSADDEGGPSAPILMEVELN
jgi:hypothetical protein